MDINDIEYINRESLKILDEARKAGGELPDVPYFGYVTADVFECPPFVVFSNNDSPVAKYIYMQRRFEPTSTKLWARLARNATGILDIGANIGVYSFIAASLRNDIYIHAFEANPFAFARLRVNKEINKFHNVVEHKFALGSKNKITEFAWTIKPGGNISSGGTVTSAKADGLERAYVEMHSLDGTGIANQLGNRVIAKIDVEGGEIDVFAGMNEVIALKPDYILETFRDKSCDVFNNMLAPLGYYFYQIQEDTGRIIQRDKLYPAVIAPPYNFNQFITMKTPDEVAALMA